MGERTAAELFERGRFSETLTAYSEEGDLEAPHKAVYTACNRAAAKLGLEMFRACIRDLDEAITLDAFCLRAYLLKGAVNPACHRLLLYSSSRCLFSSAVQIGWGKRGYHRAKH